MEAVQRACVPLVPNRLAYRELFAEKYRYGPHLGPKYRQLIEGLVKRAV